MILCLGGIYGRDLVIYTFFRTAVYCIMTFLHLYTTQSCLVFEDIHLLAFHDFFNSFKKFSVNLSVPDVNCFLEKLALTLSLYKCSSHFRTPVCKSVCCTFPSSFNLICVYPWWSNLSFSCNFCTSLFPFLVIFLYSLTVFTEISFLVSYLALTVFVQ